MNTQAQAVAALKKLGGRYVTVHADAIAKAALRGKDGVCGAQLVLELVGHTGVGQRRYCLWADVARGKVSA